MSNSSKNNTDGDISNAYHGDYDLEDISMRNISISIDNTSYPEDKDIAADDTFIHNNKNNIDINKSFDSDETYVPDVSLAYPKTPRERTQRRIVLGWTLGVSLLLISPVIIGFILGVAVVSTALWTLGFYGLIVVLHYIFQSIFAYLNLRKVTKIRNKRSADWIGASTGLLVVGYREDPELFKGCLESVINLRYAKNEKVIVVVDGNEEEDRYMGDIFSKVFSKWDHRVITTDFKIQDVGIYEARAVKLLEEVKRCTGPVCILQPHCGKRSAMYTGFQLLLQCQIDAVVVTDSDTILDPDCIKELAFMLEDKYVGAATGDVKIYNTDKMLSFLSSLRYWFAFNLERSCQSFHNCVTCVSGPLGIYRTDVLRKILDRWINQRFLGSPCTYGDDRHLTNLTLALGVSVKYTPYASCHTETPETFVRWVTQQTRWSKSFYREALYAIKVCPTQSLWMTYELIFHTIYPYILIYSLLTLIYFGNFWQLITRVLTLFFMGGLKCIYALIITRKPKFLLNFLYGIIYMIGFIPAKIQALLFLWDNGWGTSSRLKKISSKWSQTLIPFLWIAALIGGIVVNIRRFIVSKTEKFEMHHLIGILVMVGILVVAYIYYLFYQRMKKRQASEKEKHNNHHNNTAIEMV